MTNAAAWQTTHQYTEPGEYTINITAYNLHSDVEYGYNKYTHNTTRVVTIQNPVMDWDIVRGRNKALDTLNRKKNCLFIFEF